MRSRFSAAFSRFTLIAHSAMRPATTLDKLYDARHQYARKMMIVI
jgi:hypothetical protein